jgi:hypothetical protein
MPKGVGYGAGAGAGAKESHKPGATNKQKYSAKLVPAGATPIQDPNRVGPKAYKRTSGSYKSKENPFTATGMRNNAYSSQFVGKLSRNRKLLDPSAGLEKFKRRFDAGGTIARPAQTGSLGGAHKAFPGRGQSFTAGFGSHPAKASIAS